MIEVNQRVEVPASPQDVWAVLSDPHAVVECVKGASLGEQHEDGSYDAGLLVSFGPARVTFRARFSLELDPATMSGTVSSRGKDNQGGTRIKADMKFRVVPQEGGSGTTVFIDAETEVGGRLASIVESGASMVVKRMNADFAKRLSAKLSGKPMGKDED
jgi:carbon monoxide dehydrogenase subunit G